MTAITHNCEVGSKGDLGVTLVTALDYARHLLSIRRRSPTLPTSRLLHGLRDNGRVYQGSALCLDACPTDCIHPKKDEAAFETSTQLYVDPNGCRACVPVCTSDSIRPIDELPEERKAFADKNAAFYSN